VYIFVSVKTIGSFGSRGFYPYTSGNRFSYFVLHSIECRPRIHYQHPPQN